MGEVENVLNVPPNCYLCGEPCPRDVAVIRVVGGAVKTSHRVCADMSPPRKLLSDAQYDALIEKVRRA